MHVCMHACLYVCTVRFWLTLIMHYRKITHRTQRLILIHSSKQSVIYFTANNKMTPVLICTRTHTFKTFFHGLKKEKKKNKEIKYINKFIRLH